MDRVGRRAAVNHSWDWTTDDDDYYYCILHRVKQTNQCPNLDVTPKVYNEKLLFIEDLRILISNSPLSGNGLPSTDRQATDLINSDLQREQRYNDVDLATIRYWN
jgi:hypothetical protein